MKEIYLDNSATTRISVEALNEYTECSLNYYANPSSLHKSGFLAEKQVEKARKLIMKALGAKNEKEVIFTSGGTEGDNLAIFGTVNAKNKIGKHIITSKIEHHAVLDCFKYLETQGYEVTYIAVDKLGRIDLKQLENAVRDDTILISIMTVNNEVGTIQPINEIRKIAKNATIHTDAVQAFGKIDLSQIDADLITVSAHKVHGPKGIGALYVKSGTKIKNVIFGGGQEWNLRSGTLNVPAISSFGVAVSQLIDEFEENNNYINELQNYLITRLNEIDDIIINSKDKGNIVNVSFNGIRGEVLLHYLEDKNIYVSTGSACNAKSTKISYVLEAMNIDRAYAEGAVRISLSKYNTKEEIDIAIEEIKSGVAFLRKFKRR